MTRYDKDQKGGLTFKVKGLGGPTESAARKVGCAVRQGLVLLALVIQLASHP